jgi:soluble lytic murein transglycosylase-like protein
MPIVPTPPPGSTAAAPTRRVGTRLHGALWVQFAGLLAGFALAAVAQAGAQVEEQLSDSVRTAMCKALSVPSETERLHGRQPEVLAWLNDMSPRLASRMADPRDRVALLTTVHYEAVRAGLDPQLVLGLIHHESAFKKYAVSSAGALGYMQVMPFWLKQLGGCTEQFGGTNPLFDTKANIRFGTVILRYYLDTESGDLYRALGRYNGSLGRSEYPLAVLAAMERYWNYAPRKAADSGAAIATVH